MYELLFGIGGVLVLCGGGCIVTGALRNKGMLVFAGFFVAVLGNIALLVVQMDKNTQVLVVEQVLLTDDENAVIVTTTLTPGRLAQFGGEKPKTVTYYGHGLDWTIWPEAKTVESQRLIRVLLVAWYNEKVSQAAQSCQCDCREN